MRDQARPRAADGEHDLADTYGIVRETDRRQRAAVHLEQGQVGSGIASDHARGDLAVGGLCADLVVCVE